MQVDSIVLWPFKNHCFNCVKGNQTHHSAKQAQRLQILKDVTGFSSDEQHVQLVQWLVHISVILYIM